MFSAYKIIRKTVKGIDMNYIHYTPPDLSVVDLDKRLLSECINSFGKVKFDLPLKAQDARISRVGSLERAKNKPTSANIMHPIR
jgi:hypothetical protein